MTIDPKDTPALLNIVAQLTGVATDPYALNHGGKMSTYKGMLTWGRYKMLSIEDTEGGRVLILHTSTHGSAAGQKKAACLKQYLTAAHIPYMTR